MPTNAINDTGVKYLYDKLHGEIEPIAEAVSDREVTIEGNPLSFSTLSSQNAKSTILSLEPIQDLHGYDKPWVGGAGKNLLYTNLNHIKSINTNGSWADNVYTYNSTIYTVLLDNDGNINGIKVDSTSGETGSRSYFLIGEIFNKENQTIKLNGCPQGGTAGYDNVGYSLFTGGVGVTNFYDIGNGVTFTARTNSIIIYINVKSTSFTNKIFYPMARLASIIDDNYEPYTNICPISGRSEIGILGCGKNLFDGILESGAIDDITGQKSSVANRYRSANYVPVKPSTNYAFSKNGVLQANNIYLYRKDKTYIRKVGYVSTFLTSNETAYVLFYNDDVINVESGLQLEEGSIATPYEPYQSSTDLTISLGQTVYGGTLDVENGVLVVDKQKYTFNGSSGEGWSINPNYDNMYMRIRPNEALTTYGISNMYRYVTNVNLMVNGDFLIASNINIKDTIHATLEDFKTFLSNNNAEFVLELATPITINLTPHTIKLLEGVNNISTDGDKITLTYRDGSVATLGDLTSAVDNLDSKIDQSKILTDTVTGDKYILVVTNGVLSVEQISN